MAENVINGKPQSASRTKQIALGAIRIFFVFKAIWTHLEPWLLG